MKLTLYREAHNCENISLLSNFILFAIDILLAVFPV